jgi:agmatinase
MSAATPDNFLGLMDRQCDPARARVAVLPIPYDATTSFGGGARGGPRAIITASQQVELYDEALAAEPCAVGVTTLDAVEPDARGPEPTMERIHAAARPVVRSGKFLLGLGGEHSVTSPLVRAVRSRYPKLSVLQIDAHADLRDTYQNSPYSHACVMRRVVDLGVPAVGVGIRNYSKEEAQFIRRTDYPLFTARTCHTAGRWKEDILSCLTEHVYVTVDIDGFDPAYAPGTGTPEPGGLDWYQVTDLLATIAADRQIVAADVVEVSPLPPSTVTEFLAAKLAYRIIGLATR